MRTDIVPGAMFPDYELSDHTGKHRKLSELQGPHPMVLVLSRGGFCPKDRRQAELLVQLHRELEVAYCRLVNISTDNITETNESSAPTISPRQMNIAPAWARTGLSSPTRRVWFKKISTSPNTRILPTIR